MAKINIGDLRDRITIQYQTKVPDAYGSFTITWIDGFTIWAKAWTVSSTEQTSDMQTSMIRIQKFAIRYRRMFNSAWRLKFGHRFFNITGIDPDQDKEWLFLTCKEVV